MPASTDVDGHDHDYDLSQEFAGLDLLELADDQSESRGRQIWSSTWPKVAAVVLGIAIWQVVVWTGWKPRAALASPREAWDDLWRYAAEGTLTTAIGITMRRAAVGFALAVVIGTIIGSLVARVKVLRAAFGSLITGVQTMPSIAWFPLAILLFQLSEEAILFVVVLGAAPSVANGLITGADHIPPILLRAGRVLGARGLSAYRYVILPASLPAFVGGLKQGWAFAWRSLMAGELLVTIRGKESVGFLLTQNRAVNNSSGLIASMIIVLVIGIVVDSLLFGRMERAIRRRWGLLDTATT